MPSAAFMPRYPFPELIPDAFGTSEAVLNYWSEVFKTSSDFALWWTQKWLELPAAMMAFTPPAAVKPVAAAKPIAAVIDLAEAAAARIAAETADSAAAIVDIIELVAEIPMSLIEDATSVAVAAAEELTPEPDDLTRMVGIGPKLAAGLAERGITRFAQIAQWGEEDLAAIDKALDLKGRAVRDAWVAQARRFSTES